MYKHFLITRFNLSNILEPHWQTTKSGNQLLTDEWLHERFHLFKTYCFPSVKNQSNRKFTWLVFFDTNTPSHFRSKIQEMTAAFENFKPVFIDGGNAFFPSMEQFFRASLTDADQFIITTRVDNDDILHKDFIDTIQRLFKPGHNHLINLSLGYQLIVEKKETEVFEFKWRSNPFISLIESTGTSIKTVYSKKHDQWAGSAESITNYTGDRLWMVLIHKNNVFNAKKPYLKAVYRFRSENFGIGSNEVRLNSFFRIWSHNLWSYQIMRRLSFLKKKWKTYRKAAKPLAKSA